MPKLPKRTTSWSTRREPKSIEYHRLVRKILQQAKALGWSKDDFSAFCKANDAQVYLYNNSHDAILRLLNSIENQHNNDIQK